MTIRRALVLALAFLFATSVHSQVFAQAARKPVHIQGSTVLHLRVLARPFSKIYQDKSDKSQVVRDNVPAFLPLYVYSRPQVNIKSAAEKGWYEVGVNERGKVLGWMKASDVMEWKHTMCLQFTHPEGRKPVLMFDKIEALQRLVKAGSAPRTAEVDKLFKTIEEAGGKALSKDFPIVSVEPKRAVDNKTQFYLMPVLEAANVSIQGKGASEEATIVKLAAATASERGKTDIRPGAKHRQGLLMPGAGGADAQPAMKTMKIDVVYVMDMTNSMGPYIKDTLRTIGDIAALLGQKFGSSDGASRDIRFGLWGYRDSETIPGIEFNTKNFTPKLQTADQFEQTLSTVRPATVGSRNYPEDVFSGMSKGIMETAWSKDSIRFIILVGDAPSHELGHPWNASGKNETDIRTLADTQNIFVFSIHIINSDSRVARDNQVAERQFKTLASNKGDSGSHYMVVPAEDLGKFTAVSKSVAESFVAALASAKKGQVINAPTAASSTATATASAAAAASASPNTLKEEAQQKATRMIRAAMLQYLGKATNTKAPRDFMAFALDKDLVNPEIASMDICLLLNKRQLDSLVKVLKDVVQAGRKGSMGTQSFFETLKGVVASAAVDPDKVANAKTMAESGLVPDFIRGLPYKSMLLALSNERWESWSADEQSQFLNSLDSKIQAYQDIHDKSSQWIALNEGDDPDQRVFPVPLKLMP